MGSIRKLGSGALLALCAGGAATASDLNEVGAFLAYPVVTARDVCDPVDDRCESTPNHASCDNDIACDGAEVCDPVRDCQLGTPVICDDGDSCTSETCEEPNGTLRSDSEL
jgi:hypothetical protein